jgi:DNA-binding MarR family transcriptional regulator
MTAHNKGINSERLLQISGEVGRIAHALAQLPSSSPLVPSKPRPKDGRLSEIPVQVVRSAIRMRRLRAQYFKEELFADPAWDMMLDLFEAELVQRRVCVSSLCIAAAVPATTALRWIKALTGEGLFIRHGDPFDGRRVYVELSAGASSALRRYFAAVADSTVP